MKVSLRAQSEDLIPTHLEELCSLKRIEGQIRGIQKMIEEKRY